MPGMRLRHDTLRSQTYVFSDPLRPFDQPYQCGRCQSAHLGKTYHLNLDSEGAVIVSFGVLEKIRPLLGHVGLTVENYVANPPDIRVGG